MPLDEADQAVTVASARIYANDRSEDVRHLHHRAAWGAGGTYAVWCWLRTDSPPLLALAGIAALFGYAIVQTLQPADRYGRVFAA